MTLKSIFYGIASYHRPDCRTLETLLRIGIDPDRITLSLNDLIDYGTYKDRHTGKARIIYGPGKGEVHFSDIMPGIYKYFDGFKWAAANEYNTGSNKARALKYDMTMAQFLRNNWNNVKGGTSPARGYGGILQPCGVDEHGDVVYKYAGKK